MIRFTVRMDGLILGTITDKDTIDELKGKTVEVSSDEVATIMGDDRRYLKIVGRSAIQEKRQDSYRDVSWCRDVNSVIADSDHTMYKTFRESFISELKYFAYTPISFCVDEFFKLPESFNRKFAKRLLKSIDQYDRSDESDKKQIIIKAIEEVANEMDVGLPEDLCEDKYWGRAIKVIMNMME